jgi:hypothetical protein
MPFHEFGWGEGETRWWPNFLFDLFNVNKKWEPVYYFAHPHFHRIKKF